MTLLYIYPSINIKFLLYFLKGGNADTGFNVFCGQALFSANSGAWYLPTYLIPGKKEIVPVLGTHVAGTSTITAS